MPDKSHNKHIGAMLKNMRIYRELTQQDVATFLDSSTQYISNIESGRATISVDRLAKLSAIYNCYLDIKLTPVD